MSPVSRTLATIAATALLAGGMSGAARAGGLASLCAEYETRSVVGIIEDLLTEVDDCVRVAAAPADSPRPVPRPVLLAAAPPAFVPLSPLVSRVVTGTAGSPILVGGGRGRPPGGNGFPVLPFIPIGGGGEEPTGSNIVEEGGRVPPPDEPSPPTEVLVPAVPLPGSGALLALGLLGPAGMLAARRRRHPVA